MFGLSVADICADLKTDVISFLKNKKFGFKLVCGLFDKFRTIAKVQENKKQAAEFVSATLENLDFEVIEGETSKSGIYMEVSCHYYFHLCLFYPFKIFILQLRLNQLIR